ncbi:methylenetetrahydrofolate reductase [NAD(P)H] [Wenzhouxiangella sp. C33]|uniref:Methylenetetrahydrofolate reductase n=1 Tax=Wenzhouxiangella limi TaxID=2707351 RepID=A0A845UZS1_9GAMM|nr:methylenetetrahydrofolate reductase [NAD(P)H] [Wenzhouxiangella limi]
MEAPQLSFEFFPPRDDVQTARFRTARDRLLALHPDYVSVTFGAGGSTRSRTVDTVREIAEASGIPVAPHISCMSEDLDSLRQLLESYDRFGVKRLVVLRGDRPSGRYAGVFEHAADLVADIRQRWGSRFHLEVACYPEHHPESPSPAADLRHFRDKVAAGADGAITQYFFNAECYFRFVDDARALGVDVPIVPGVMPITNYQGLARFSRTCGAEIPQWIDKRLQAWDAEGDRESLIEFGHEVVCNLCRRLLDGGAPGLHFYTLNRAGPSLRLCSDLGLGNR